ncbi:MAG: hypothetical protein LIO96_09800 [Lachnospiraceae bacterium]|nr:hypothetical protein [Lachnospiraceae bacterium]
MKVHKYQDVKLPEDYVDIHYREQNAQINGLFRYLETMDSIQGRNDQGIRVIPVADVYFLRRWIVRHGRIWKRKYIRYRRPVKTGPS